MCSCGTNHSLDVYSIIDSENVPEGVVVRNKSVDANSGKELVQSDYSVSDVNIEIYSLEKKGKIQYLFIKDSNFVSIENLKIGDIIDTNKMEIVNKPGVYNYVTLDKGLLGVVIENRISFFTWNAVISE